VGANPRWLRRALVGAVALCLSASPAWPQQWPPELIAVYEPLASDNPKVRYEARDRFVRALGDLPDARRADAIGELIEAFDRHDYRRQLGIATALAKQAQPWVGRDMDKQIRTLYAAMLKSKDESLNRAVDDALANAKGYYRDAVIDYNRDRIDDLDDVVAKFKRTPDHLPKSRYAPNSLFYLGQYLTRAYLLGHDKGDALVRQSLSVLDDFTKTQDKGSTDLWDDAFYYSGLNRVLVGDAAGAVARLQEMERRSTQSSRVYVYQFFFSKRKDTVIDRTFIAPVLARKTREYIGEHRTISPADQKPFITYVTKG
jgi:hypothetical protein